MLKSRAKTSPSLITGKPISLWGSKGRTAATGLGVSACIMAVLEKHEIDVRGTRIIIQGLGNVGSYCAKIMAGAGAKIIGISNTSGGWYAPDGIDVERAFSYAATNPHRLAGYTQPGVEELDPDDILEQETDVLVPCALEGAIHSRSADKIKAKFIVEGGNGSVTPEADLVLADKGVFIVPDFLANSGGVIGSYFEWVQDLIPILFQT